MSVLERLIVFITAQYRWGLHPIKVAIALLLPVLILWVADWRIGQLSNATRRDDGEPGRRASGD